MVAGGAAESCGRGGAGASPSSLAASRFRHLASFPSPGLGKCPLRAGGPCRPRLMQPRSTKLSERRMPFGAETRRCGWTAGRGAAAGPDRAGPANRAFRRAAEMRSGDRAPARLALHAARTGKDASAACRLVFFQRIAQLVCGRSRVGFSWSRASRNWCARREHPCV